MQLQIEQPGRIDWKRKAWDTLDVLVAKRPSDHLIAGSWSDDDSFEEIPAMNCGSNIDLAAAVKRELVTMGHHMTSIERDGHRWWVVIKA